MDVSEMESQINSLQETIASLSGRITQMENVINSFASHGEVAELENRVGFLPQLTQMTVTDGSGCVPRERIGTIMSAPQAASSLPDPYLFYATERVNSGSGGLPPKEIQMVLPIGGQQSGLYRFPRVGERILVAEMDKGNFLMGYLPSTHTPFLGTAESENVAGMLDTLGEVFRYEKTGPDLSNSEYSEIGFHKHEADWPIRIDEELVYPEIDRINIQSTGDIRTTAENHHQIQAKRFEILAGCPEVNHRTHLTADGEQPLGDNPGDDSALHGGDAHIRAGNRVVIKAENEICLQVGRTVLSMSDEGFSVKSKVTNSNFENVLDATLGLSPRDGINMFGYNVNVSSAKGFQIGDSYGGSMSSTVGVVGVNGREVKLSAYDSMEYAYTTLYALFQIIQCSASGGAAIDGAEDVNTAQYVNFTFDMVQRIIEVVKNVYEGYQARQQTKTIEDEEARVKAAEEEVRKAKEDADKAAGEESAAEEKVKKGKDDADEADRQAEKAKAEADAKKKEADEAAARKEAADKKRNDDEAAANKAKADADDAAAKANKAKADADEADTAAKAAKTQADDDAAAALQKKQEADSAGEAAAKAKKDLDKDEKAGQVLDERIEANEKSATRHDEKAEAAAESAAKHEEVGAALVAETGAVLAKIDTLDRQIADENNAKAKALLDKEQAVAEKARQALEAQVGSEAAQAKKDKLEADTEKQRADDARQSADQKREEREANKQKIELDKDAVTSTQQDADTRRQESDEARSKAVKSKQESDEADSNANTTRRDADKAEADADRKNEAAKGAETKKTQSEMEAGAAAADAADKRQSADDANDAAAAKVRDADTRKEELGTAEQDLQAKQEAKAHADAVLKEKEAQAAQAKKDYDAAVAATASSALTDEFDQAIDVEGEAVHYERPDYDPVKDKV
ncbi:MAG: hypothetical protein LBI85_07945 [Spirochaetaceae bacterium]|jgi:hypothetical protein|nr:hypothetical protein [Spirochaetaceae bacterium]